jgi:squalene cyclase
MIYGKLCNVARITADGSSVTVDKAIEWIHDAQREDGSWYGSWGVCFTYATMFALESLGIAGETYENSERVRRACEFLRGKQMDDGGWGETYMVSGVIWKIAVMLTGVA